MALVYALPVTHEVRGRGRGGATLTQRGHLSFGFARRGQVNVAPTPWLAPGTGQRRERRQRWLAQRPLAVPRERAARRPRVTRRGEGAREDREPRRAAPARGDKRGLAAPLARSARSPVD